MHRRIGPHMLVIGWFSLLICLWTTGDQVIDLVFEAPDVAFGSDASAEEPDNAAEHVLMPSQRADTLTEVAAGPVTDLDAYSITVTVRDNATLRAVPSLHHPPRNRPISFSVPLRI